MGNCCCCCSSREPIVQPPPLICPPGPAPPIRQRVSPREKIVVGIHPFKAKDLKDLSFNKGDHMKVLENTEGDRWLLVEHICTMRRGYVPSNFVAPALSLECYDWFVGTTPRRKAEILILGDEKQPAGTFLVRLSENGQYSLSVKHVDKKEGNHVMHYRIERTNGKFYIARESKFRTIPDLVSAYSSKMYTHNSLLSQPCQKPEPDIFDLSSTYRDKWEIERSEIKILEKLGSGNFGEVYRGIWNDRYNVAIKTLKGDSTSSKAEFLKEAGIMKTFRHENLVLLYGVCTIKEPFYIVQEYMENGSVLHNLRIDQGRTLKFEDLIFIAYQVAKGMEHLESIRYVHRDLAARNVLLGLNCVAKICDFGLARMGNQHGHCIEGGKMPVKWSSPESLDGVFTTKSDIWSYGVFLMELFTYGESPYKDIPYNVIMVMIRAGRSMPKPKNHNLPDGIYNNVMLQCWLLNPNERPTFKYLVKYFDEYYGHSYEHHLPRRPD